MLQRSPRGAVQKRMHAWPNNQTSQSINNKKKRILQYANKSIQPGMISWKLE